MPVINPYLTFNGNCEEAFIFYKSVFGGEFTFMGRFSDMPPSDDYQVSPEDMNKIMHVSLPISDETILMGSDTSEHFGAVQMGNNISISITTDSEEEATRIFDGLSAEGNVIMPLEKVFWGALYGMFVDKYGIGWSVSYQLEEENQ